MSKVENISVISFLSFCIIVGSLVFSRGFLLNRQTIQERSGPCSSNPRNIPVTARSHSNNVSVSSQVHGPGGNNEDPGLGSGGLSSTSSWCNSSPPFSKMIMVLVDALRFDFVQRMKFMSRVTGEMSSSQSGATTCLFKFVADPPTTTMQRLKALMTGTMPTFIDASANFNSYEIEEDSLIYQLEAIGKKIAFLGDDTWLSLFPKRYFKSPFVEAHPSFNAWDLDTVDRAVNKTLREILQPAHRDEWDVLITHLLGVDHCGHRYGPAHPEMVRKLNEADAIVEHVYNSMSNDTLLVIFGDHGMTSTGDHGGDSKDETESAVIFLSKQFKRNKQFSPPFQCSKQLSISQIDLVPTLAPLLGIPIPYSNIGQIIPDFLVNKTYSDAVAANVAQVHKYIQHFSIMLSAAGSTTSDGNSTQGGTLIEQYQRIEEAFTDYQSSRNSATRARLHLLSQRYLKHVKSVAVSAWTQFNLPMIYTGVAITSLSALSLSIYLASVPRLINYNTENQYSVLSWLWPSLSHWSVLCTFVSHSASLSGLLGIIVSTLSGISVFLLIILFKIGQATIRLRNFKKETSSNRFRIYFEISEIASIVLYVFTCLVVFSNSFLINEGYVLGTTLILVVLTRLMCYNETEQELGISYDSDLQRPTQEDNLLGLPVAKKTFRCSWSCFVVLAAIIRTSSIFFRCREEQVICNEEYLLHKQLSSLPEDWLVHKYLRYGIALLTLAVFVVSFRHWMIYRRCIFSRKPRAVIARFIPSLLVVLLGVFWALQGLPYISSNASKVRLLINHLPLVYQIVTVSSLVCVWLRPICCIGHIRSLSYMNSFNKITKRNECAVNIRAPINYLNHLNGNTKYENLPNNGNNKKSLFSSTTINGIKKTNGVNGTITDFQSNNSLEIYSLPDIKKSEKLRVVENQINGVTQFNDCFSDDTYSSCFLTIGVLLTLLLIQVTSTGIAPAITLAAYSIVCLVGIYRTSSNKDAGSWSSAIAWSLSSQYFFYATGHQPIFSAIPWDSAFVGAGDGSGLASSSVSWVAWARAGLAVIGNLHVSQILFSFTLPLLVYWKVGKGKQESQMGKSERRKAYILCGKYIALHGLKLLMCMSCAAWHRRHLMVWKIFAPKFIFEAVSFIVTSSAVLLCMVFISRIHYFHQNALTRFGSRSV